MIKQIKRKKEIKNRKENVARLQEHSSVPDSTSRFSH